MVNRRLIPEWSGDIVLYQFVSLCNYFMFNCSIVLFICIVVLYSSLFCCVLFFLFLLRSNFIFFSSIR